MAPAWRPIEMKTSFMQPRQRPGLCRDEPRQPTDPAGLAPAGRTHRRQLPPGGRCLPVPALQDGQVLVRHHYLSLDPYMRMPHERRQELRAAAAAGRRDGRRHGGRGGRVAPPGLCRRRPRGGRGRLAAVLGGRRRHAGPAAQGRHHAHPAVGLPGRGGHAGRHRLGGPHADHRRPRPARPWSSAPPAAPWARAVGQLAKSRGCRVVGIAGGADKCAYVVDELGLRRLHRLQGAPRPEGAERGAEGSRAEGHRRLLRERRRRHPRRRDGPHERLRPHRRVRHDRRLQRRTAGRWPTRR